MRRDYLIYALLIIITFAAFGRVLVNDFVVYDDDKYVTHNEHIKAGLTLEGLAWAFTAFHAANWHPLTWISHMADCSVYDMKPWGHHLTSLLLHVANVLLLFHILKLMTGSTWRTALVAALFGVHPLHVESVAWISERKDVLSTFFWLITMWAYYRYSRCPKVGSYIPVVLFFALGLMSKPMLVTLPFVLLLLDWWPLGRISLKSYSLVFKPGSIVRQLLNEKIPLFALAVASSIVTFIAQKEGGAVGTLMEIPLDMRIGNAFLSYIRYIGKMIWPRPLVVFYPHSIHGLPIWWVIFASILFLAITWLVIKQMHQRPYMGVGWFWYIGTLVPVIGIIQVGSQAMADRYTYIPLIGIFIMLAWGIPDYFNTRIKEKAPKVSSILPSITCVIIAVFVVCTWYQVGYWKDTITLFGHTLPITGSNYVVHNNLGVALSEKKQYEQAIAHFQKVLEVEPNDPDTNYNMGNALVAIGRFSEAAKYYRAAIKADPNYAYAHNNLGNILSQQGRLDEAIEEYKKALQAKPDDLDIKRNLETALSQRAKKINTAASLYEAIKANPNNAKAHYELAVILENQSDFEGAIEHFSIAARLEPSYAAHYHLANIFSKMGRVDEAIRHYREAIRLNPKRFEAHYNLANTLSRQGKLDEAIGEYVEVIRLKPDFADAHNNLAIALFEKGDYAGAWHHVYLSQQNGGNPHPEFIRALSEHMPDPGG
ncbi:MAG: tetratricopeptide repeat protein [Armatimonadota bacterium]|nr:tetratricopeptide repeat protein [Armatimonadota bacterium]